MNFRRIMFALFLVVMAILTIALYHSAQHMFDAAQLYKESEQ